MGVPVSSPRSAKVIDLSAVGTRAELACSLDVPVPAIDAVSLETMACRNKGCTLSAAARNKGDTSIIPGCPLMTAQSTSEGTCPDKFAPLAARSRRRATSPVSTASLSRVAILSL